MEVRQFHDEDDDDADGLGSADKMRVERRGVEGAAGKWSKPLSLTVEKGNYLRHETHRWG